MTTIDASHATGDLTIRPVTRAERPAAIHRLVQRGAPSSSQVEYFEAVAQDFGIDDRYLWGSFRRDGFMEAAALLVPQAGRTAMLFATSPADVVEVPRIAALIGAVSDAAPLERATLGQALLDPDAHLARDAFRGAGYGTLARLRYMQATVPRRSPEPSVPDDVTFHRWHNSMRGDFLRAMEESYERTLDCPALQGLRRTDDVLAGHMATGEFDADLWTLVRCDGRTAGVMMLNNVPAAGGVELVYLGLGAKWRGRGLGKLLMKRAQWQCAQRGLRTVMLAVDESNTPALKLYEAFGFRGQMTKLALLRQLGRGKS